MENVVNLVAIHNERDPRYTAEETLIMNCKYLTDLASMNPLPDVAELREAHDAIGRAIEAIAASR
jgi:hypothetical protein